MTVKLSKAYIDTETCGLHSMPVLLQYAIDDGPIHLYDIWKEPIGKTLDLIEWLTEHCVVGFNLAFDWFQIVKCYTIFRLCPRDWIPEQHIHEIAMLEPKGQKGPCVKPANALDLLLHSRKGPYQSLMARSDIRIRRVPVALAYALAAELEQRVEIDNIYFAKSADKDAPRWQVFDIKRKDGTPHPDLKDVVLRFNPAGGLKFLAEHCLGLSPKYHYSDVEPPRDWYPKELGFSPTALSISSPKKNWALFKTDKETKQKRIVGYAWPAQISKFIEHWATHEAAREYATDDIVYTRALDEKFGFPEPGDNDSILSCMVPIIRWHGFKINQKGMKALLHNAQKIVDDAPININKPSEVREYVFDAMDDIEQMCPFGESTRKANLVGVTKMKVDADEECSKCFGDGHDERGRDCVRCDGTGELRADRFEVVETEGKERGNHPAAVRARDILNVKFAGKEVELYRKLIKAKKFHASFNVVGTLSSRMSGGDGLNAQGIKKTKEVRRMFPLAWGRYKLCGGDFDSFEVTLADATYNDENLRRDLLSGKKIHALFAMCLFPGKSYEDILASEGSSNDMYAKGKSAVFALIYGGDYQTLVKNLSIDEDIARAAFERFNRMYPGVAKAREKTFGDFCSMVQPAGIGSMVVWNEPKDYVESFLGFRRYFTLENKICKALFDLARKPPKGWRECKMKVQRTKDRFQTAGGAVASALYGAAFQIQAGNMRAAANHEIQSPGGEITKAVQRNIWDLQPVGVHPLYVAPMNVHDELMTATHPKYVARVTEKVREGVERYRPAVPLIGMSWFEEMASWAEKKDSAVKIKIRCEEMMKFD